MARHVYLTGFMGAGKSTIGGFLARLLGRPFIDLDQQIEESSGQTISEIFSSRGEAAFRELENKALRSLDDRLPMVVAMGGGTLSRAANRKWVDARGTTVWLDVPFEILLDRLERQEQDRRPLFDSETQMRTLYRRRLADYRTADLRFEVAADEAAEVVAASIRDLLEERGCAT